MFHSSPSPHDRLIRKLESITTLSEEDRAALRRLPMHLKRLRARDDIVNEGDRPSHCCLLVDGLMHRYKSLPDGTRSVLTYHIPGELPDLQSLFLHTLDHSIGAVTESQVAMIPHQAVHDLIRERSSIMAALWRETLIDAAIFREWIVNVGSRSARARLAHLIAEMFERFRSVGLADEDGFVLPITQTDLGEATGMSAVHVNRSLQELRAEKLIASEGRFLHILNWSGLKKAGGYEPQYLHLNRALTEDA